MIVIYQFYSIIKCFIKKITNGVSICCSTSSSVWNISVYFFLFEGFVLGFQWFSHSGGLGAHPASSARCPRGAVSLVVTRAYFANEARIDRKITGKSSSFDLVWVLWGLQQARDHSEPVWCSSLDFEKGIFFQRFTCLVQAASCSFSHEEWPERMSHIAGFRPTLTNFPFFTHVGESGSVERRVGKLLERR